MDWKLTDRSDEAKRMMEEAIEKALTEIGEHIEGEAAEELENSPRRVDTGNLKNSISHELASGENAVYIGTNVEYSIYVHEGTTRMAPNRFLKNAMTRNEKQVREKLERELKAEFR